MMLWSFSKVLLMRYTLYKGSSSIILLVKLNLLHRSLVLLGTTLSILKYSMSGTFTAKSDGYSFDVVMLEFLTGRKPFESSRPRSEQSCWATPQLHDLDALSRMVDPALEGVYLVKSLSCLANISSLCVQLLDPKFRPPMSEVVQSLVRLMQRATSNNRQMIFNSGFSQMGIPDFDYSFSH